MVFIPPPHLASASRPSYAEAYSDILAAHRRSPLTSASSVILLVAPDVDALCAARMLTDLLKQDDVMHRIIPVSGIAELEHVRDELMTYTEVRRGDRPFSSIQLLSALSSSTPYFSSTWAPFSIFLPSNGLVTLLRTSMCTLSTPAARRICPVSSAAEGMENA